jgi:uncharacterized membrane protein HdeD (DUF308 family)
MPFEALKNELHRLRWSLLIRGLIAVTLGVLIIAKPLDSVAAFALLIAYWALFTGITETVQAFELRRHFSGWWLHLLGGLVSIGFGVAALYYYPGLSLSYAVILVSYWLLLSGIVQLSAAFLHRRTGLPWAWGLASGIVSLLAGIGALVVPPLTLAAILSFIAAFALISGITLLIGAFRMGSVEHAVAPA